MRKVLILGGYGNFGKRIARALTKKSVPVIIAGRDAQKATALAATLPTGLSEIAVFDAAQMLEKQLPKLGPAVVINTCGPFQTSGYDIARACLRHGVHYIDLADGRDFVTGITTLDADAKQAGVTVVSGASTVPGLSSAVVSHFAPEFQTIDSLIFGITPGQRAERGLATTQGILSYVGKPLRPVSGQPQTVYGWQDIYRQDYPQLGQRWMANCDIPDLDLLPKRYGIKSIRFSAGLELGFLHLGLWALSWLVRAGIPLNLPRYAAPLLRFSNWFDRFGSAAGGMHITLKGAGLDGRQQERRWFIIARNGDGPQIPTVPAILLAEKLAKGGRLPQGAMPCIGMVTLEEYLVELEAFAIETHTDTAKR